MSVLITNAESPDLRPGGVDIATAGGDVSRFVRHRQKSSLRGARAPKQSSFVIKALDCFAALAMTWRGDST
jgi:hypothetical protein